MIDQNSNQKDWVGLWYTLAKEEAGINDLISFYQVHLLTMSIVKQVDLSHSQTDGLGGLLRVLEQNGVPVLKSPQSKTKPISNIFKKLSVLYKARNISKYHQVPWKEFNPQHRAANSEYDLAFKVLNEKNSTMIEACAKTHGGSVNSWLLYHLNKIITEQYFAKPSQGTWLFPVNMRGGLGTRPSSMNNSSAISIEIDPEDQHFDVHGQIKNRLKSNVHWVVWWSLQMGQVTGINYMKKVSKRRRENNFCLGTFSNMGEFQSEKSDFIWTFSPPGTPNFPFGMSLLKWNGQWVLTLKKHPAVGLSLVKSDEILTELLNRILVF